MSNVIGWRRIKMSDCARGVAVQLRNIKDSPFNGGTIIGVDKSDPAVYYIKVARPYVYASEHCDTSSPLVGTEIFEIAISEKQYAVDHVYVYEGKNGLLTMLSG